MYSRSTEVWPLSEGVGRSSFPGELAPGISSMGRAFWGREDREEGDRTACIGKSQLSGMFYIYTYIYIYIIYIFIYIFHIYVYVK